MHPILFRIPLPQYPLPFFWVLLGAGGLAIAVAVWQMAIKNRSNAAIAGALGAAGVAAGFYFKGQTWDMGPIPIYSYGVMLGLSLVVGWYLTLGLAERDGLPKETMANNYVVTAVAAVIGSRILYILTNLSEFDSIGSMFAMRRGGLVAYGGFLGGFAGSYFFLRRHKIPLLPWADVAVPSLASGLMITRIGCYLFGCDFGRPQCGAPGFPDCATAAAPPSWLQKLGSFPHWAEGTLEHGSGSPAWVQHVKERGLSHDATHSFPVHPTQLYESLVGLGLLALLLTARRYQKFRGQIFLLFTFAYGVCRFLLEIVRDDAERGAIGLPIPQHIVFPFCLALLAVGYLIGFSHMVKNPTVRKVTQGLAFVPPIALYFILRPETFATSVTGELSTSQLVAVTTGFGAAIAFSVFWKAALAHPESAMSLGLPRPEDAKKPAAAADDDEDEDDEEDEEEIAARKRAAARKAADRPAAKPKVSTPPPAGAGGSAKAKGKTSGGKGKAGKKSLAPAAPAAAGTEKPKGDGDADRAAKSDAPSKGEAAKDGDDAATSTEER